MVNSDNNLYNEFLDVVSDLMILLSLENWMSALIITASAECSIVLTWRITAFWCAGS